MTTYSRVMTQNQYLQEGGALCPCCKSDQVSGESFTVDQGVASQAVVCQVCGSDWQDLYTLAGYTNATVADVCLTVEELAERHKGADGAWGQHPDFPRSDWQQAVAEDDTLQGYWQWVGSQLEQEAEAKG